MRRTHAAVGLHGSTIAWQPESTLFELWLKACQLCLEWIRPICRCKGSPFVLEARILAIDLAARLLLRQVKRTYIFLLRQVVKGWMDETMHA